MSKQPILTAGLLLLLCVSVTALAGGCRKAESTGDRGTRSPRYGEQQPAGGPAVPLLENWSQPAVALLLTGEQYGYLEPCGCSETQSGGMGRRHDLVGQLEKKGWTVAGLDLGGTVRRDRRQSQLKFETILAGLRDMHYRAVALGPEELRFGPEYLLSQQPADPYDPQAVLFLGANVVLFDAPDLGTPRQFRIVTANGVKIGVTSILSPAVAESLLPKGSLADIRIDSPAEALARVVPQLQQEQPDLLVLLSRAGLEESRRLAERFPQFDVVVSGGGPEDPDGKPQQVGETLLLTVGHKGKHVGVVGFYPDETDQRLRYELVDLDSRRFRESERMREHMREYQSKLSYEQLVALEPPISHPDRPDARFVGAKKCAECHTKAYAKWKSTKHAHAYESLARGRKGLEETWISRIHDPECLACHVTGWHPQEVLRYESGFVNEEFLSDPADKAHSRLLKGQQCENCHGPGSRHVELEQAVRDGGGIDQQRLTAGRQEMRLTVAAARDRVCYRCHDLDNSPDFQFDKFWEEVKHPWRD